MTVRELHRPLIKKGAKLKFEQKTDQGTGSSEVQSRSFLSSLVISSVRKKLINQIRNELSFKTPSFEDALLQETHRSNQLFSV